MTLQVAAGLAPNPKGATAHRTSFVEGRIKEGTPWVTGGLPLNVASVGLPDGTHGPWRDPFCWASIATEVVTLQHACKLVVMACTAMRDSELDLIP